MAHHLAGKQSHCTNHIWYQQQFPLAVSTKMKRNVANKFHTIERYVVIWRWQAYCAAWRLAIQVIVVSFAIEILGHASITIRTLVGKKEQTLIIQVSVSFHNHSFNSRLFLRSEGKPHPFFCVGLCNSYDIDIYSMCIGAGQSVGSKKQSIKCLSERCAACLGTIAPSLKSNLRIFMRRYFAGIIHIWWIVFKTLI